MQGWQTVKLGDVCDFQNGFAFKSSKFTDRGTPILRISNIQKGNISLDKLVYTNVSSYKEDLSRYAVETGDLLIAMSGATTGKIGVNNTENTYLLNQRVGKFIPSKQLNKTFLYYFLSTKVEENLLISGGAAQPNLSTSQIKNMDIPNLAFPEQQRIVEILDYAFEGIDKAIANTEKNLKNARELFESELNRIFTQKGEGWESVKLGDVAEVSSGGTPKKSNPSYWGDEISWYSSGELNNIFTCDPKNKITQDGLENSNAKLFPRGSLLIGMYDTAALKMSILDRDAAFNQAIAGVKPCGNLHLEFVMMQIIFFKPQLLELRRGVRQQNLNQSAIKNIVLSIPSLMEQNHIVNSMRSYQGKIQELEKCYTQKLEHLNQLKQSLLHKAFTGELTKDMADTTTSEALGA